MATTQDFLFQIKAARDSGKDINLDDVVFALDCFYGLAGGYRADWSDTPDRMLDHWRRRGSPMKESRTAALAAD